MALCWLTRLWVRADEQVIRNGLKVLQFGSLLCNLSNRGDLQVH